MDLQLERRPSRSQTPSASTPYAISHTSPITRRDQQLVLLTAFVSVFLTIGPNLSYGVFQSHYLSPQSSLPLDDRSPALVALVGTLGAGLTWGASIFIGPLQSRTSPTLLPLIGTVFTSLSFVLASFARSLPLLLLTQGLLYGFGAGALYFPLVSRAPPYFSTRRASAMGLVLSAGGLGGLAYSVGTRALLSSVGTAWTLRFLGAWTAVLGVPAALLARPSRSSPGENSVLVPLHVARKPAFALQAAAALLQAAGNFVPMTFAAEFSQVVGYSASFGAVLLGLNNAVNAASRLITGFAADRWGRQNVLVLSVLGSAGAVMGLWLGSVEGANDGNQGKGLWVSFVVVYGMLAGGYMSLFPVTISEVFGPAAYASVNSFLYFVRGIGALFGSPVGGQILGDAKGAEVLSDYRKLIWYDGALLAACSVCVVGVRAFDAIEKKNWKWKA